MKWKPSTNKWIKMLNMSINTTWMLWTLQLQDQHIYSISPCFSGLFKRYVTRHVYYSVNFKISCLWHSNESNVLVQSQILCFRNCPISTYSVGCLPDSHGFYLDRDLHCNQGFYATVLLKKKHLLMKCFIVFV